MSTPLAAGRELDALVASSVMGWVDVEKRPIANAMGQHVLDDFTGIAPEGTGRQTLVPRFSTLLQDGWSVAERLRRGFQFVAVISGTGPSGQQVPWVCKVNKEGVFIEERGDTAPLAICLAALRAAGPRP